MKGRRGVPGGARDGKEPEAGGAVKKTGLGIQGCVS